MVALLGIVQKKCAKNYFIFVLSLIFSDTNFTDFNLS